MTKTTETTETTIFSSGANSPAEIEALVISGINPGVAINHLSEAGLAAIEFWAGTEWNLFFVDSGAFSEVSFTAAGPAITAEITASEWEKRLAKYDRLARSMKGQVFLVAPDCVAHQAETLTRLNTYGDRVLGWMACGANVIVPVQKGALSMSDFARQVAYDLCVSTDDVVWGIPMKKDATSLAELGAFVAELQPARIHLLGMGSRSKAFRQAVATVLEANPECQVFCDSVRITALVGKTNGKGGGPRPITKYLAQGCGKHRAVVCAMRDEDREELADLAAQGWTDPELSDSWMPKGQLALF